MTTANALLDLVIKGPPVSLQGRRRKRVHEYSDEVGARAAVAYPGAAPYTGMVRVEITFFYDTIAGDVDDIAKPILDGLEGVVIANDAQAMDVLASKRPIAASRYTGMPEQVVRLLMAGREFVHVLVMPFNLERAEAE